MEFKNRQELKDAICNKEITLEEYKKHDDAFEAEEQEIINKLIVGGNTYLAEMVKLKEERTYLRNEERELQQKLYDVQRTLRCNNDRSDYLMALQWNIETVYPVWSKDYYESSYRKENYTRFTFHADNTFGVYIKERTALKVWKFEVTCSKDDEVRKFKTYDEALACAEELKIVIETDNKPAIDEWFNLRVQAYEVLKSLEKFTLWNRECFARRI